MFNLTMISFHKNTDCPSSQELLDFQNNKATAKQTLVIREHICVCDFCGAESEFYSHCPKVGDEQIKVTQIPAPLYELAEALLNNKHKDFTLLNKLLIENDGLMLREA